MKTVLILSLILLTLTFPAWLLFNSKPEPKQNLIDDMAAVIIQNIDHLDSARIHDLLVSHYRILGLINKDEIWADPDLEAIADNLLPVLSNEDLRAFIMEIASQQNQNPYLKKFLNDPAIQDFIPEIRTEANLVGSDLFPRVVTFAIALDRLTQAMLNDTKILALCIDIFTEKKENGWYELFINQQEAEKLALVADMAQKFLTQIQTGGTIEPSFLVLELQENINWAVTVDDKKGLTNNALAGQILSRYHPNYDGQSPPSFTDNNSIIQVKTPYSEQWTNLYTTWNMAFVANDYHFPFLITKLLIPTIGSYHEEPGRFPQARTLSLYTYMHYHFFERLDYNHKNNPHGTIELPIPLLELWGQINAASSNEYIDLF